MLSIRFYFIFQKIKVENKDSVMKERAAFVIALFPLFVGE